MSAPYFEDDLVTLHLGDCLDVLAGMEPGSVDAVVCDPPYALTELPTAAIVDALSAWLGGDRAYVPKTAGGFMGRDWDKFVPPPAAWDACMRVLKPGGHLLAFAAPRTQDLMGISVRLAGFEIRDGLAWLFGQGMPKSLDVSKAIDKSAGAERPVTAQGAPLKRMIPGATQNATGSWLKDNGREYIPQVTEPATADAARWDGWGTGLKPSHEPVIVARKPLAGTVAANVLQFGTGALNIDGCKVGSETVTTHSRGRNTAFPKRPGETTVEESGRTRRQDLVDRSPREGRWAPNVLLTHLADCQLVGTREVRSDGHHPAARGESGYQGGWGGQDGLAERRSGTETVEAWDCAPGCPVAELDRQSGVLTSGANPTRRNSDKFSDAYGEFAGEMERPRRGADSGGASRFFPVFRYEAKAPASERPRVKRTMLRLRDDLTDEERAYVLAELTKAGIDAA